MLEWDITDFTAYFEVAPEELESEYHGPFSIFRLEKYGIHLEVTVFPLEEDVTLQLMRVGEEHPIFEYHIMSCKSATIERAEDGTESLIFVSQVDTLVMVCVKPDIKVTITDSGV